MHLLHIFSLRIMTTITERLILGFSTTANSVNSFERIRSAMFPADGSSIRVSNYYFFLNRKPAINNVSSFLVTFIFGMVFCSFFALSFLVSKATHFPSSNYASLVLPASFLLNCLAKVSKNASMR